MNIHSQRFPEWQATPTVQPYCVGVRLILQIGHHDAVQVGHLETSGQHEKIRHCTCAAVER